MNDLKIINPASGSIIMALGIFLYASIEAFPFLDQILGKLFTIILVILGIGIYIALTRQFFHKDFLFPFLNNPVNSFVMGSWIAGISVLCNVIMKYFPGIKEVVQAITIVNTFLWLLFLVCCVYNFIQLWKRPTRHSTHGVILLSAVATQSIVILWGELFTIVSDAFLISTLFLGLLFYLCGILLIGIRYKNKKQWSLKEDWSNTNCIIHGALSITGLAIVSFELMSATLIMFFWLFVFIVVLLIESVEIIRAVIRVDNFGWRKGIGTYNISQWSRNFTFGMFYAFTMTMHDNPYYRNLMYDFHEGFLSLWAWIVFVFLIVEVSLLIESRWHFLDKERKKSTIRIH